MGIFDCCCSERDGKEAAGNCDGAGGSGGGDMLFLVWSDTSMGTMTLFFKPPSGADGQVIAKVAISKAPPGFKLTSNGGRQQLSMNCGVKKTFLTTYLNFLKQAWQYQPTKIEIVGQPKGQSAKVVLLEKSSNKVKPCPSSLSFSYSSIAAIAVVGADNNALNAGTMEPKFFVQKAMNEGAAETV